MKKITLLAAAVFMMANAAEASELINFSGTPRNSFNFDQPITFTERGIDFFIFPNGEFDFNTEPTIGNDTYYKGRRGNSINTTYGAPGTFNEGIRIEHDALGRIRRIGNVFVNYDSANRIKRIGTVYMNYHRSALTQVGGLKIIYDRRGRIVDIIGSVKGRQGYAFQSNYQPQGYNNYASGFNDNDYYYYKSDGTKALIEDKEEVIKK